MNVNEFSPNLVCALILLRSGLGLLSSKFCQFLTELSVHDTSAFSVQVNILSKPQQIFTKSDIVETWFGIAIGCITSIFNIFISARQDNGRVLSFHIYI